MDVIYDKGKEVLYSVFPVVAIVIMLHFSLTPIDTMMIARFLLGAALIVVGLTIFLLGVDIGISPTGTILGSTIARTNRLWLVAAAGLLLGFFISIAEPDLHILAGQVDAVTLGQISKSSIVAVVSVGIAVMVAIGLIRIVYNVRLRTLLVVTYGLILIIALFASPEFLAIAFDASGATTGALTVPFILALAFGVSKLKKDSRSSETDSFGLVAIASMGPIIAVLVMSILSGTQQVEGSLTRLSIRSTSLLDPFIEELPIIAGDSLIALAPIILIFLVFQRVSFRLPGQVVRRILFGMLFTLTGLVLFLLGVNAGFMEVGRTVGFELASMDNHIYVILVGLILGMVTVLAEPAVNVLTHQIEDVTSGYVKRSMVLATLALGVALAVALSVLRILIPEIHLWHYLLPGYMVALTLTYMVPGLFVGIAFDSGGVASGPMTATFILAFTQGIAEAVDGANVMVDGFGLIAMVAMTPLIAVQVLGLVYKIKSRKEGIEAHG